MSSNTDELLTRVDLARVFKLSTKTIDRNSRTPPPGWPPVIRIGGAVRYRMADVRQYLATLAGAPTPTQVD